MIIRNCSIYCYSKEVSLEFTSNCYWVRITEKMEDGTKKELFKRVPSEKNWIDPKHRKITNALHALEEAIKEACDIESRPDPVETTQEESE